jgi:hypothetical protein
MVADVFGWRYLHPAGFCASIHTGIYKYIEYIIDLSLERKAIILYIPIVNCFQF